MRDPFEVLGLPEGASIDEATAAYRRLVQEWHPDRHVGAGPHQHALAEMRMAEISGAYRLLLDPGALARWRGANRHLVDAGAACHTPPVDLGDDVTGPPFDYREVAPDEFYLDRD